MFFRDENKSKKGLIRGLDVNNKTQERRRSFDQNERDDVRD